MAMQSTIQTQFAWQAGVVPIEASTLRAPGSVTLRPWLTFDGVDDYVTVPGMPLMDSGQFTWEVKLTPTQVSKDQMFLGPQNASTAFYFRILNARPFVSILTAQGQKTVAGNTTLVNGTEYWLQATYDFRRLTVFVNGVPDGSLDVGSRNTALSPWDIGRIGRWQDADPRSFVGHINEARVYSYVIPQAEMGIPQTGDGYFGEALWLFDEGSGLIAKDSQANRYDGTLSGGVQWTYPASATITTKTINLDAFTTTNLAFWLQSSVPAGCGATIQSVAFSPDGNNWGAGTAPVDGIIPDGGQFMQAQILLTSDGLLTPTVTQFGVKTWAPRPLMTAPAVVSVGQTTGPIATVGVAGGPI